jgi:NitT/TauT family transport system substrate-binding protein
MRTKIKILTALLLMITTTIFIAGCGSTKTADEGKVKVRLNEVTRSVFYAPMYVAMSQGFFEENGIEIDLQTGQAP